MSSLAVNSLAERFGGGAVARLAAHQALQSRQTSAEQSRISPETSTASAGCTAPAALQPPQLGGTGSGVEGHSRGWLPPQHPLSPLSAAPGEVDEALLLSGLLNRGAVASAAGQRLTVQRRPAPLQHPSHQATQHALAGGEGSAGCCTEADMSAECSSEMSYGGMPSPRCMRRNSSCSSSSGMETVPDADAGLSLRERSRWAGARSTRAGAIPGQAGSQEEGDEKKQEARLAYSMAGAPAASSHAASMALLRGPQAARAPHTSRAAAVTVSAGACPSHRPTFLDAEDDTVLTGSPVRGGHLSNSGRSSGSGGSSGGSSHGGSPGVDTRGGGSTAPCDRHPPGTNARAAVTPAALLALPPAQLPQPGGTAKEVLKQQVWSFDAILPEGRRGSAAGIPGKASGGCGVPGTAAVPSARRRAGSSGMPSSGELAIHGRAATDPTAAAAEVQSAEGRARSAPGAAERQQQRRQRLEQLARPRYAASKRLPHHQYYYQHDGQQLPSGTSAIADAALQGFEAPTGLPAAALGGEDSPLLPHGKAGTPAACASQTATQGIGAWRGLPAATAPAVPAPAAPAGPAGRAKERVGGIPASSTQWPTQLGRELGAAELQRATGAFSEERFQRHLSKLSAELAARRQRHLQAADSAATGVDEFVAQVKQLGTGTSSAAGPGSPSGITDRDGVASGASGVGSDAPKGSCVANGCSGEVQQTQCSQQALKQHCQMEASWPSPGAVPDQPAVEVEAGAAPAGTHHPGPAPFAEPCVEGEVLRSSLTERLLNCQQQLGCQRPATAPLVGCCSPDSLRRLCQPEQRPASSSPPKVKPLMQVEGEQDWALHQLRQQGGGRPFRASPLPLSTVEPRYQRQVEQREQRRAAAHQQRRQFLLGQQQPFGMEEREAERRQRRLLIGQPVLVQGACVAPGTAATLGEAAAGDGGSRAAAGAGADRPRPRTPAFHALPVPVSTTEARYALLVAEMQLQGHSMRGGKGLGLASPPSRPATARHAVPAGSPRGDPGMRPQRPATAAAGALALAEVAAAQPWRPPSASEGHGLPGAWQQRAGGSSGGVHGVRSGSSSSSSVSVSASGRGGAWATSLEATAEAAAAGGAAGAPSRVEEGPSDADCETCITAMAAPATIDTGETGAVAPLQPNTAAAYGDAAPPAQVPVEQQAGGAGQLQPGGAEGCWARDDCSSGRQASDAAREAAEAGSDAATRSRQAPLTAAAAAAQPPPAQAATAVSSSPAREPAVSSSPRTGASRVKTNRSQQLREEALRYSLAAGRYAMPAERASWDAADVEDVRLLHQPPRQLPPPPQELGESWDAGAAAEAGGGAASRSRQPTAGPVVQHLGCQAGAVSASHGQQPARPGAAPAEQPLQALQAEIGIAVPLHCEAAMAHSCLKMARGCSDGCGAGWYNQGCTPGGVVRSSDITRAAVGAELVPAALHLLHGSSTENSEAAPSPATAASPAAQQRRDTPRQHIAARQRQAEAAAQREVRQVLRKRGAAIERLFDNGKG